MNFEDLINVAGPYQRFSLRISGKNTIPVTKEEYYESKDKILPDFKKEISAIFVGYVSGYQNVIIAIPK